MPVDPERHNPDGNKANTTDPAAKNKFVSIGLDELPISSHWQHKTRIKWTILLFIGCVLVYSVRTSMSIAVTAMSGELGWNKQVSGMVLSSFFAGYVTTNILLHSSLALPWLPWMKFRHRGSVNLQSQSTVCPPVTRRVGSCRWRQCSPQ